MTISSGGKDYISKKYFIIDILQGIALAVNDVTSKLFPFGDTAQGVTIARVAGSLDRKKGVACNTPKIAIVFRYEII